MKKWNTPLLEELDIWETAHGGRGQHGGSHHDNDHRDDHRNDCTITIPPTTAPVQPGGSGNTEIGDNDSIS